MYQGKIAAGLRVREVEAAKLDQSGFGSGCMLVRRCHMHQQRCRAQMHSSQPTMCFLTILNNIFSYEVKALDVSNKCSHSILCSTV